MDLSFLAYDTLTAAQALLGKYIYTEQDGAVTGGYITEVEAYLGEHDKAAHAYQLRRTKKNEMMYRDFWHHLCIYNAWSPLYEFYNER